MVVLESRNLCDVDFFEGGLELFGVSEIGCHLGVLSLVGALELVDN